MSEKDEAIYDDLLSNLPTVSAHAFSCGGQWGIEIGFNPHKTKQKNLTFTFHQISVEAAEVLISGLQRAVAEAKDESNPLTLFAEEAGE